MEAPRQPGYVFAALMKNEAAALATYHAIELLILPLVPKTEYCIFRMRIGGEPYEDWGDHYVVVLGDKPLPTRVEVKLLSVLLEGEPVALPPGAVEAAHTYWEQFRHSSSGRMSHHYEQGLLVTRI